METLHGVWKQHLRPRAVVGYGLKIFLPSPPNYVTRSPGECYRNTFVIERLKDKIKDICLFQIRKAFLIGNY